MERRLATSRPVARPTTFKPIARPAIRYKSTSASTSNRLCSSQEFFLSLSILPVSATQTDTDPLYYQPAKPAIIMPLTAS